MTNTPLFLFFLCCAGFAVARHTKRRAAKAASIHILNPTEYDAETTALVFDLHGVLFNLDGALLAKRFVPGFFHMVYEAARLMRKHPKNMTIWREACEPFENAQKKCKKTWTTIIELVAQGYRVYIFSNIRPKTFKKLAEAHPELIHNTIFAGSIITGPEAEWRIKPDPLYFAHCEKIITTQFPEIKNFLFFDDKIGNCTIASARSGAVTWHGIHVQSDAQCTAVLKQLLMQPTV